MSAPYEELPESQVLKHVADLRTAFFAQYADVTPAKYDVRDVDRARQSDTWLRHFLLHQKYDITNAANMMNTVLVWRKEFGVNDITEDSIPLEIREKGAVFFHNKSMSHNDILYFAIRLYKKGDEEYNKNTRNLIVFMLDQYQRRNPLHRIVALLDMSSVGLSNVDLGLTKFMVTCFTTYFPGILAVWAVVKLMLSEEEQKHVVFCKKNSIQQHVEKSQLFPHMGGTDTFTYRYTEPIFEDEEVTYEETEGDHTDFTGASSGDHPDTASVTMTSSLPDIAQQVPASADRATPKKHVNWAADDEVKEFTPPSNSSTLDGASTSQTGSSTGGTTSSRVDRSDSVESGSTSPNKPSAYKISIIPKSELQFTRPGINQEASCSIKLTNDQIFTLAYKVKTTDPKNYRVKQGRGVLQPTHSETVHITLLAGKEIKRDKFLVLSTKLNSDDVTQSELSALWKNTTKSQIHEHKLRCHETVQLDPEESVDQTRNTSVTSTSSVAYTSILNKSSLIAKEGQLEPRLEKLQSDVDQIKLILKIMLSLLVVLIGVVIIR